MKPVTLSRSAGRSTTARHSTPLHEITGGALLVPARVRRRGNPVHNQKEGAISMKLKTAILAGSALALFSTAAIAEDMTVVSWGGAYQASQKAAYTDPYVKMHPDINVIWDESSAEAVAKLRAMNEAGNVTWGPRRRRGIRRHPSLRRRPRHADRSRQGPRSRSGRNVCFGRLRRPPGFGMFHSQIVYSTTFGYRTDIADWAARLLTTSATCST